MVRSPDWEPVRLAAAADLKPGERVSVIFGALIPHEFSRGHVIAAELAPLLWLMDHALWRHRARAASRSAQIPLAPRMIIAVTGRRLVIWAARRGWRSGQILGALPRDQIIDVTAAATGTRSRLLVLHLSNGQTVALQIALLGRRDDDCVQSGLGKQRAHRVQPWSAIGAHRAEERQADTEVVQQLGSLAGKFWLLGVEVARRVHVE